MPPLGQCLSIGSSATQEERRRTKNKMTKHTKLGLGATVGVVAALATLVVFVGAALAAGSASLDSPTAAADGTAVVTLKMAAPAGSGVGNWAFDVGFDPAKYTGDPTCTATPGGSCTVKPAGAAGIVRFAGADGSATGLTGETTVGTVTFKTTLTTGCSDLTLKIAAAAGSAFQDQTGTDFASPTFTSGKVCAPATAAPTAAATTAAALPKTGGPTGDSSLQLGWLAAAAGVLIVVAAGAWTFARAREDS